MSAATKRPGGLASKAYRLAGETLARLATGLPLEALTLLEGASERKPRPASGGPTGDLALVTVAGIAAELVGAGRKEPALSDEIAARAYRAVPWVRPEPLARIAVVARQIVCDEWARVDLLASELARLGQLGTSDVVRLAASARRGCA